MHHRNMRHFRRRLQELPRSQYTIAYWNMMCGCNINGGFRHGLDREERRRPWSTGPGN